jgi:hypothetical protein
MAAVPLDSPPAAVRWDDDLVQLYERSYSASASNPGSHTSVPDARRCSSCPAATRTGPVATLHLFLDTHDGTNLRIAEAWPC